MLVRGLAACPSLRLLGELGRGLLGKASSLLQGWSGPCITPVLGHQGLLCYGFDLYQLQRVEMGGSLFGMWLCQQLLRLGIVVFINTLLSSREM